MTKLPSVKYMQLVDEMIQDNRTTVETVYLKNATRLHESTRKMEQQLNNTITISVDTLKDIASVIDTAAEYVKAIQPNQTEKLMKFSKDKTAIVESGNQTINSVFEPHYVAAEKLSRNVSRLLKLIEINTNQARTVNLEFCLIEPTKPLRISCLQNILKFYTRYLVRVKNSLKSYNEYNSSVQRKIDNATRTTLIRTFQGAHGSARTVVKNMFQESGITPDMVMQHTQEKITQYSNAIQSYFSRTHGKLKVIGNVYDNFYHEHDNYKTIFDGLKNLALLAVDVILYSRNVTASDLDYVKEELNKRSREHFRKLTNYYDDLRYNFEFIRKQLFSTAEKFHQSKSIKVSCSDTVSDIAYLFDCVHERIGHYREILNTTRRVYNGSRMYAENIVEDSDIYNRKVYDEFTLDVYNLTLNLIKEYDLEVADIISYEEMVVQSKYNDTELAINKTSDKYNEEFLQELEAKITVMSSVNDVIDKVINSFQDNDKSTAKANELLTELNETVADLYDRGSDNILTKISNITDYSAEYKMYDIVSTMGEDSLAKKCSISNSSRLDVVKVAHVLQCVEREQTKFNHSMNAVVSDYVILTSELEEMNSLFLHDVQGALRNGIKRVLTLVRDKQPAFNALTCLNGVDIRKTNSGQLETGLKRCGSVVAE